MHTHTYTYTQYYYIPDWRKRLFLLPASLADGTHTTRWCVCVCVGDIELRCICPFAQETSWYEVCHFLHSYRSARESSRWLRRKLLYSSLTFREVSHRSVRSGKVSVEGGYDELSGDSWELYYPVNMRGRLTRPVGWMRGLESSWWGFWLCKEHTNVSNCDCVWTCKDAGKLLLSLTSGLELYTHNDRRIELIIISSVEWFIASLTACKTLWIKASA